MSDNSRNEKPPAGGPGVNASASRPLPSPSSANLPDWPAVGLAVSHVAARYGLPLQWAAVVAVAAGLGRCGQ